ncbi:hypothetical protein A6A06_19890 [Streptomyces sp. CB02923]|uniref:DUF7848 domain-containing protein n=1 Tax=Streptomyces sp. CB02923 TaxID=1718985 RepID=UPI00093CF370|nr:hypothetical protein [Streptomyces sp. CB02923]OKI01107.1 hypothetical protein A6A06_19890 [Streptomyces sp. CB02923]
MSTHAVYRYVPHTIRHVPEGGVSYEAFCTAAGCDAESGPQEDQDPAQQWALRHSGLTGHDLFRRVVSDHARVTREG